MRSRSHGLREAWKDARLGWSMAWLAFLSLSLDKLSEGDWWWMALNAAGCFFAAFCSWIAHTRIPDEPRITVNITADASQFNAAVEEAIKRLRIEQRARNGGLL